MSPVERVVPNRVADERDALTQQFDFHRATLLRKLEGLDGEQLRSPMTASGLSLLGLVKHLAETEHGWFLKIYGGLPEPFIGPDQQALEEMLAGFEPTAAAAGVVAWCARRPFRAEVTSSLRV
jgi:hypothetical protein